MPPQVASLVAFTDGVKWGMSHAELTKQFTQTGGVIWKDYDEKLAKARVGPEQTALEAEREQVKAAFSRSYIEFKDTPTGYDATGIRNEYTYKNKRALMWISARGRNATSSSSTIQPLEDLRRGPARRRRADGQRVSRRGQQAERPAQRAGPRAGRRRRKGIRRDDR